MNTYSYIRVSTTDQDTEKNKNAVLQFANAKAFPSPVHFTEEKISGQTSWKNRELADLVEEMQAGDILIVPELSRLGRSLQDVLDVLQVLTDKEIKVYSVKENFQLNGDDIQSKVMRTMIGLFAEIHSDIHSQRVREGMQAAKANGKTFGRPTGNGHSSLDPHEQEILNLIKNGSTKRFIARKFDVTTANLYHWLKTRGHQDVEPEL
jgi:DNA invertase Pin-like site-specific DNA recombinase